MKRISAIIVTMLLYAPLYLVQASECAPPERVGSGTANTQTATIGLVISDPLQTVAVNHTARSDLPPVSSPPSREERAYFLHINCYDKAIDSVFSRDDQRPIVLFVHGRGQHPAKLIKRKLLAQIERDYNAHVIGFTWPSWSGMGGFPIEGAHAAATALQEVIGLIARQRNRQEGRHVVMLTHSMGALVLEQLVKQESDQPINALDAVIVSAAASDYRAHGEWLDQIRFTDDVYIVFNRNDKVLKCLESDTGLNPVGLFMGCGRYDLSPRLGRWGNNGNEAEQHRARTVSYVDLTPQAGNTHRYYIGHASEGDATFNWFNSVINPGLDLEPIPER